MLEGLCCHLLMTLRYNGCAQSNMSHIHLDTEIPAKQRVYNLCKCCGPACTVADLTNEAVGDHLKAIMPDGRH